MASKWAVVAVIGVAAMTGCGASDDQSPLAGAGNPILANFSSELDWWHLCDDLAEIGEDDDQIRRELIDAPFDEENPYDADDVDKFLATASGRCAEYRDSRDADAVFGSLTLDDLETACAHRWDHGWADFHLTHIDDTFSEPVGDSLDDQLDEACKSYKAPDEEESNVPTATGAPPTIDDSEAAVQPTNAPADSEEAADIEALRLWLSSDWNDVAAVDGGRTATAPTGHACIELAQTTGENSYVKCLSMPGASSLEAACSSAANLSQVFASQGRTAWISAASSLDDSVQDLAFSTETATFEVQTDGFVVLDTGTEELLAGEAGFLSDAVSDGIEASGPMSERRQYVADVAFVVCGLRIELPTVVDLIGQATEDALFAVGDDPLFARLPITEGQSGDHVLELQQALVRIGIDVGSSGADGDFGPATASAIGQLQYDNQIADSRELDIDTLAALRASIPADVVSSDQSDCPTISEVEEYITSTERDLPEGSTKISEIRCILLPSGARPMIARLTTPDSVDYSLIVEQHVVWLEIARGATRSDLCAVVPGELETYVDSDVEPFVKALDC